MKSHKKISIQLIQLMLSFLVLLILSSCEVVVENETKHEDSDGVDNQNYSASESFFYNIVVNDQNYLSLNSINGNINITGIDSGESVVISGERIVKSESRSDAKEHLELLQVEIEENVSDITIKTDQPDKSEGRNYTINYNIKVPSNWQINVDHVNGNLEIVNIKNDIDASLINGKVDLSDIFGNVDVSIVNGSFTGDVTISLNGYCQVNLVNGTINLEIPTSTSADFSASVVNGLIRLNDLALENLSTSPHRASGTLGEGEGNIDLETVNGPITVDGF